MTTRRFAWLACALLALAVSARGQSFAFETATLGATGQTGGVGSSIDSLQFLGAKFNVLLPVRITSLGGHVSASSGSSLFVAIVPLARISDFPSDFSLSDAVFSTTFEPPSASAEVTVTADFRLPAGRYGIVFGSGLFGATGFGTAPGNDTDVGTPEYFFSDNGVPVYTNGGFSDTRFFVNGSVELFSDGFESGDSAAWSVTVP